MLAPSSWIGKPRSSNASAQGSHERKSGRKPPAKTTAPNPSSGTSLRRRAVERRRLGDLRPRKAALVGDPKHLGHDLPVPRVTPGRRVGEVGGEPRLGAGGPQEVADERHAHRPGACGGLRSWPPPWPVAIGLAPRRAAGTAGCDRLAEESRLLEPPDEVAATQPARRPRGLPARQDDVPAGFPELLGELAARLPAADDQDRARRQARLVAVLLHVDPQEAGRQRVGAGGAVGTLERAGAQDDAGGVHVAGRRPGDEAAR